jgi:uncharacterized membrane-anchored protein
MLVGSRSMTASRGILSLFFLFMIIWLTAEVIEKPRGVRKSAHTRREREREREKLDNRALEHTHKAIGFFPQYRGIWNL